MLKKIISLGYLGFVFAFNSWADLTPYLKKIDDKFGNHSMRNIDFIYMINLDQRAEKLASCLVQLEPYGIFPYRFSAVIGRELSLDTINSIGVKLSPEMQKGQIGTSYYFEDQETPTNVVVQQCGQTYFCKSISRGGIGCVLSHLSILQDAYDSGYETIWVMEDDIEVVQNPHLISEYIDKLDALVGKEGWDILFTDRDTKNQNGEYVPCTAIAWRPNFQSSMPPIYFRLKKNISEEFRKVGARYGTYSMIVRRSGMKKLLDFLNTYMIFLPYDLDYIFPPKIRLFTVQKDIVSTQIHALSDIPKFPDR